MTVHIISTGLSILGFFRLPTSTKYSKAEIPDAALVGKAWTENRLHCPATQERLEQDLESAFGVDSGDNSPQRDAFRRTAEELHAAVWPTIPKVSAEFDTLRVAEDRGSSDVHVFIASHTPDGLTAAVWNAIAVAGGDVDRIVFLPDLDVATRWRRSADSNVLIIQLKGMDAVTAAGFHEPMRVLGLLGRMLVGDRPRGLENLASEDEKVMFQLSGGYKAAIPYLLALAEWVRSVGTREVQAVVRFEDAEDDRRILLPLRRFDIDDVRDELAEFDGDGLRETDNGLRLLDGYAYEPGSRGDRLTGFGTGMKAMFGDAEEASR